MHRDVNPKKFLGQHFLIDDNISKKIVETINFQKFKKVIEVGPGKGALTKHLLHIKDMLTLIEVDKESVEFLNSDFQKEKLNIIEADFLKFDIGSTYPSEKDILIIGNFPYNISSQILFKSIDNYPIIFISALTKQRIHKVLETSWTVYKRIIHRLSTKKLNDTLKLIIEKNPPSSRISIMTSLTSYGLVGSSGTIESNLSQILFAGSLVFLTGGFSMLLDGRKSTNSLAKSIALWSSSAVK